ncbi:hypothetical protein ES705_17859 [subsurface metagenome]
MKRKNLLSLHEAIVVALINMTNRQGSFEEIADFIETRNLFPERKGNISLAEQVKLRTTKSSDIHYYLGEATHKIIELNNLFTRKEINLKNN